MSTVEAAVSDVSRSIARLDEQPDGAALAELVAANLAHQFARLGRNAARMITGRDVRAALIAHGASKLTAERWAQRIGTQIRETYSM